MMKSCLLWLSLIDDLLHFVVLNLCSRNSLAAENLFLRKQLAFYQERHIRPRRTSDQARLTRLWLSRWFAWRSALTVVTRPQSSAQMRLGQAEHPIEAVTPATGTCGSGRSPAAAQSGFQPR